MRAGRASAVAPSNGGRFSCGAEVRLSTILNGSATWPRGGSWSEESWPRSADSYKRLLGIRLLRRYLPHGVVSSIGLIDGHRTPVAEPLPVLEAGLLLRVFSLGVPGVATKVA